MFVRLLSCSSVSLFELARWLSRSLPLPLLLSLSLPLSMGCDWTLRWLHDHGHVKRPLLDSAAAPQLGPGDSPGCQGQRQRANNQIGRHQSFSPAASDENTINHRWLAGASSLRHNQPASQDPAASLISNSSSEALSWPLEGKLALKCRARPPSPDFVANQTKPTKRRLNKNCAPRTEQSRECSV